MSEHPPRRPGYDCDRCGRPWPCAPAKVQLAESYAGDTTGLGMHMCLHMREALGEAVADHDWGRVDDLFERFVGWMPRPHGIES